MLLLATHSNSRTHALRPPTVPGMDHDGSEPGMARHTQHAPSSAAHISKHVGHTLHAYRASTTLQNKSVGQLEPPMAAGRISRSYSQPRGSASQPHVPAEGLVLRLRQVAPTADP